MCKDVKISQCRLVRVRFVFEKRWGGVPLRCALKTSIEGLIWSCNLHAKSIFEIFVLVAVLEHAGLPAHLTAHIPARVVSPCNVTFPCLHSSDAEQNFTIEIEIRNPNFEVFPQDI